MHDAPYRRIPVYSSEGIAAWAMVDEVDYERLARHRWCFTSNGYVKRTQRVGLRADNKKITIRLHREVLDLGGWGPTVEVDHINGDRLDCRRLNLRVVTRAENNQNVPSRRGASSRHRGVTYDIQTGRWKAQVQFAGRNHHLGRFDRESDAAEAAESFRATHMTYGSDRN